MLRLAFSPRWVLWHLLTLGAMVTCGALAAWQWQRAGTAMGSALNVGYGLQWPVFAVFFGVMWWRMLRMESRALGSAADAVEAAEAVTAAAASAPETPAPVAAPPVRSDGPSPFTARPRGVVAEAPDTDPVRAEYNRRLAELASRDQRP